MKTVMVETLSAVYTNNAILELDSKGLRRNPSIVFIVERKILSKNCQYALIGATEERQYRVT